jgi:hypothetical protein
MGIVFICISTPLDFEIILLGIQNQLIFLVFVWTLKLHDFRGRKTWKRGMNWGDYLLAWSVCELLSIFQSPCSSYVYIHCPNWWHNTFLYSANHFKVTVSLKKKEREREMERSIFNIQVCLVSLTKNHTKKNFHEIVACWGGQKIGNENACCSLSPMSPRRSVDLS